MMVEKGGRMGWRKVVRELEEVKENMLND